MKAIVADPTGGPENLKYMDFPTPEPGEGEVLVKIEAIGVNFIDVYFRKGLYKAPEDPVKLGNEGAGTIAAVGAGVNLPIGQRVAYAMARGSYAEYALVPQSVLVQLPDSINFETGAAIMLQGMTAHYLTRSTFDLKRGHICLIHAAAGGVGLLLVQMAKIAGATVIGTVSTEEKAQLIKEHGADHAILYTRTNFAEEVKRITGNRGVEVAYDSVGRTTFHKSLDCLRPRGLMASFGQSSGPIGEIDPLLLTQKGSLFLTRPSLANYISDPDELRWRSSDIFNWIASGRLSVRIHQTYKLADAAAAHRDLEARKTSGKLLLKP
ncbi:MAG: quinone oxidoreductase [Acidobacteriaceae bacterium]|nr:quinone oxidoreductase [Acidobacteriaceae bacterium]MBV9767718.1 quinone oxidoreductase [Acidobacteriaceae bacterium]